MDAGDNKTAGDEVLVKLSLVVRRQRDIAKKKNMAVYTQYLAAVPKETRGPEHPTTPNPNWKCSARSWKGSVKDWGRRLHRFNNDNEKNR